MITSEELISLGTLRRPQLKDLPPFVFAMRDGLFVPFKCEDAVNLLGEEVFVLRKDIQDEEDGLLTWQDLVGYTVEDNGTAVGIIRHVDEQTINTLATLEDGRMMPLHEDFILEIDTDAHILRVNLPFAL
ncbi:MAG: hypothetical protein K6A36_06530 [Paludibacteraceae bacterium]|nr:hypothetical protein [Paludibacteraceae bacterium]